MRNKWKRLAPLLVIALLLGASAAYLGQYYPAGEAAAAALQSDGTVEVLRTDYGWRFDGPSVSDALIFYPGAKVAAEAYAPLLRRLAELGMDACLVEMPLRISLLGTNRADAVMREHDYERWFIGGHSLGGLSAADYAAGHPGAVDGVVLLAAYTTAQLPEDMDVVFIHGTQDGVLNRKRFARCRKNAPADAAEVVIEGGNHAGFGDYGPQQGDGEAAISPGEQAERTARMILEFAEAEG